MKYQLPLHVQNEALGFPSQRTIADATSRIVAMVGGYGSSFSQDEEWAAGIVAAVNSLPALVEALKWALPLVKLTTYWRPTDAELKQEHKDQAALVSAFAALAALPSADTVTP